MSKVLVRTMVRADSERVQNKCLIELGGKPAFVQAMERVLDVYPNPDYVAVVCPLEMVNDPIERIAKQYGYDVVRNLRHRTYEFAGATDHFGLTSDDFVVCVSADSLFRYAKAVPFCLEKMQEYDLDFASLILSPNTMGSAAGVVTIERALLHRSAVKKSHIWDIQGVTCARQKGYGSHLLVDMPKYLDEPWPWAIQALDWPLQAVTAKAVYEELYKGKPIDIREVRTLFEKDPLLANMVPPDALAANQPVFPHGPHGLIEQSIVNTCGHVRVRFDE